MGSSLFTFIQNRLDLAYLAEPTGSKGEQVCEVVGPNSEQECGLLSAASTAWDKRDIQPQLKTRPSGGLTDEFSAFPSRAFCTLLSSTVYSVHTGLL